MRNPETAHQPARTSLAIVATGPGYSPTTIFSFSPATRLGVHYRSSVKLDLDGDTTFTGTPPQLANGPVKLEVKTPDSLAVSVAHRLNDRWELLGDVTWWQWSKIQTVPLVRTNNGQQVGAFVFNFDDSIRVAVGANYKLDNAWTLKVGAAYDQTPVPSAEQRTVKGGKLLVYRRKRGENCWEPSGDVAPDEPHHVSVLRDAMTADGLEPEGIYFGTTSGELYLSMDQGERWQRLPGQYSRILNVKSWVVEK